MLGILPSEKSNEAIANIGQSAKGESACVKSYQLDMARTGLQIKQSSKIKAEIGRAHV